ncbi:MAG: Lrp/AsnC family transcriptional regulator [Bacteroidota bacterium]
MDSPSFTLDKIDIDILRHLQLDGRKSFTDMAEEMKVSVSTIRNRVNKLKTEGILHIIGWTDPVKTGYHAYARVTIDVKPSSFLREVATHLLCIEEVSFLAITSGPYDLEINLLCKDNSHLLEVMHEQIHPLEGVHATHTTLYFEVLKWASHKVQAGSSDPLPPVSANTHLEA